MQAKRVIGAVLVVSLVGGGVFAACFDYVDDCRLLATCCPDGTLDCLTAGSGGHDGGTGTGGQVNCDPTTGVVDATCGVFVSSSMGEDGNAGSEAMPLKSLSAAVMKAGATRVYACGEGFDEAVTLAAAVTLYGALDCANGWAYDPSKKTQLTAAAEAVPLTLASTAGGSGVYDFAITAADATTAGGSSITVLDDGAGVTLERVDITAGNGAAGAAGMMQTAVVTPAGAAGTDGGADTACNLPGVFGGAGGKNTCGGTDVGGGVGGQGVAGSSGGAGSPGNPMMTPSNAGTGQTMSMACGAGQPGAMGSTGMSGTGARGIGDIGAMGYMGAIAMPGAPGGPAQGGGGGGGAYACDSMGDFAGASGGGGGAGGCPGAPGNPGQSGGSSIGLLALGVTPVLMTVSITTHDGGAGGIGANGQAGGAGGAPGKAGGSASCAGGIGGTGGTGGTAGGGAGGHSVAVAVEGAALPDMSSAKITLGNGGTGGPGGDMTAQTAGDGGMACMTLDFTNPASPTVCAM